MRRLLLLSLLLTACTTTGEFSGGTTPVSARLSSELLKIRLSNGTNCIGGVLTDGTKNWTGPLQGCPEGWRFRVALSNQTNPARYIVEEVMTALTIEDSLSPRAEVTVFDPVNNATVFISP